MIRWIVKTSLQYRFLVVALAVVLVVFGVTRINQMPVDVFPEFAPPRVEIQTESPGMSTAEVEELITIPLEEVLSGTPELYVMRSKSVPALSSILLIFEPGTDGWLARQLVDERLALAIPNLPAGIIPYMLQPLSSTSRALKIGLTSDELDMIELSAIAFWKIRPALVAIPGVANVAMWGERLQQFQVQVDPEVLRAYDLSLDHVLEVTADALEVGILNYERSVLPKNSRVLRYAWNALLLHPLASLKKTHEWTRDFRRAWKKERHQTNSRNIVPRVERTQNKRAC